MSQAERLYTPELLALTLRLAEYPWIEGLPLAGSARSKSCGSTLAMGLETDAEGHIARLGMRVHACAVGQSAAAIFADEAPGKDLGAIQAALADIEAWLHGAAPLPGWPGLDAIAAARDFPGRHGAMLLPWQAALAALSTKQASG